MCDGGGIARFFLGHGEGLDFSPRGPLSIFPVRLGVSGSENDGFAIEAESGLRDSIFRVNRMN